MPDAVIDACCLIDLLASAREDEILRAAAFTWHLPSAVQSEVKYRRQHDPAAPGKVTTIPVDLSPMVSSGLLTVCNPMGQPELDRFTHYASIFRSDGESMCLALAECRGWTIATDDRKAIRVAQQAGLSVISCPELLKRWADANTVDATVLVPVLQEIELLAQFKPNASMPQYKWWVNSLAGGSP